MTVNLRGVRTVLLPGTGSDDDYLVRAFSEALAAAGSALVAATPRPDGLIAGYRAALEAAAADGPIAVGGMSIGAAVAMNWALTHPHRTVAVIAALPAWSGAPDGAPAALSAVHTATVLRRDGLARTTAEMRASSPRWLGDELARSWSAQWPALPDAMVEAASYVAPELTDIALLTAPVGVVGAVGDAIHPLTVAHDWAAAAPHSAMRTVTLEQMGVDPSTLGAACVAAALAARRA